MKRINIDINLVITIANVGISLLLLLFIIIGLFSFSSLSWGINVLIIIVLLFPLAFFCHRIAPRFVCQIIYLIESISKTLDSKGNADNDIKIDPIEKDPRYKDIIEKAGLEAEKVLSDQGIIKTMGYCHRYWRLKKQILKRVYNVDWKTPAELNPNRKFD
ncbi:hypothetical protein [Pseudobacteroides cellulosolvens]|uniref:Uncharacterized protein n=1 Tax=Pseudobacteroides cellulosolvens ATCC 35603 = DSM 2933 TaxID=398512 RepID=A0A0L6JXC1_9FIRM|nr:hypothetical protein [Pseudobacteroides cellulosolvens]KNY30092.1 hypothetical protein Bccel_5369 [Pseudobacteroides cellulosolvens ATCC 35603 = DSM 2933]